LAQAITSARNLADLVNDAQYRLAPALAVVEGPMMAGGGANGSEMYADAKGRECVNALFPKAHIAWADDCGEMLPREWRAFTINLPDVVAATETLLPLEITRGANLDEATPDALAFLLAMGVHRQGARCAVWHGGRLDIYVPHAADNNSRGIKA
jgi:hypothetical protein